MSGRDMDKCGAGVATRRPGRHYGIRDRLPPPRERHDGDEPAIPERDANWLAIGGGIAWGDDDGDDDVLDRFASRRSA